MSADELIRLWLVSALWFVAKLACLAFVISFAVGRAIRRERYRAQREQYAARRRSEDRPYTTLGGRPR